MYYIEKPRDANLEDTSIPNLFITDFLPDVPDGDFVKVYIYAYMCCRQSIALTHAQLAERIGVDVAKVFAAWRYFAERRIVNLTFFSSDEGHFDVEIVDVKGMLYGRDKRSPKNGIHMKNGASSLTDTALASLFQSIASIMGAPSIDGGDAQRIIGWIDEDGAAPEVIEFAYMFARDERGEKRSKYIGKIVGEWTEKGFKTVADVRGHLAKTNARNASHKKLMEALGLRYSVITAAEEEKFNRWQDEYGYTLERLLELAEKTAGVGNKLKYLEGIIRKEREAEGKTATVAGMRTRGGMKDRNEHYRMIRRKNEDSTAACMQEVYASVPTVKSADDDIALLNMELVRTLTSGMNDKQGAIDRLNSEIETAVAQRREFLKKAGYAEDYTDVKYDCLRCRDTGILENGGSCDCFMK